MNTSNIKLVKLRMWTINQVKTNHCKIIYNHFQFKISMSLNSKLYKEYYFYLKFIAIILNKS